MSFALYLLACFLCLLLLSCDNVRSSPASDAWTVYNWIGDKKIFTAELRKLKSVIGKHQIETNVLVTDDATVKIPLTVTFEITDRGTYLRSCYYEEGANGPTGVAATGSTIIRPAGSKQAYTLNCLMHDGITIKKLVISDAEKEPLPQMGKPRASKELCAVANGQATPLTWFVKDTRDIYNNIPIIFTLQCTTAGAVVVSCSGPGDVQVTAGGNAKEFTWKPQSDYRNKQFSLSCDGEKGATIDKL